MHVTDRLAQLRKMLEKAPQDAFLQYAVALELKKAGDLVGALSHLARTLELDGDYLYAYYQQGQVEEERGNVAAARTAYESGIRRATAKGDAKALGELRGALAGLGSAGG